LNFVEVWCFEYLKIIYSPELPTEPEIPGRSTSAVPWRWRLILASLNCSSRVAGEIRETAPSQPERIVGLASIYRKQGKVADAGRELRESQKLQNPATQPESVPK